MLWPKKQHQKAGYTGSFGLSVIVPKRHIEHPLKHPELAGSRESSHPSPSWKQSLRVQGEDVYPPALQHHPMHEVLVYSGSQSPLGGWEPCMLCWQGVWLLFWECCCGMGHPARHPLARVLPARRCKVARECQDDSPPPSAP